MRMIFVMMLILVTTGCISKRAANPAATQPVTRVDPQLAEKEYWLAKPAIAHVHGPFEPLWQAAEDTAHEFLFRIDRRDQRSGVMTTEPMVSKQWWEFWRKDSGTFRDSEEATLATIRRTIFFQFKKESDGGYSVTPKVVVEKESKVDPRYRDEFEGPMTYWYALRRDQVMEQKVADSIKKHLDKAAKAQAAAR